MMRGKKFLLFFVVFIFLMTLSVFFFAEKNFEKKSNLKNSFLITAAYADPDPDPGEGESGGQEGQEGENEDDNSLNAQVQALGNRLSALDPEHGKGEDGSGGDPKYTNLWANWNSLSEQIGELDEDDDEYQTKKQQIQSSIDNLKATLDALENPTTPTPTPNPTDTVTPTPTPTPTTDTTETPATQEEIQEANNEAVENLSDGTQETSDAIDAAKEALENAGVTKQLSAEEAAALVQNQKEIAAEKTTEAVNNKVAETTVPAASDLLSDTPLSNLDNLSAAPKATEPGRPTAEEQNQIVNNLNASNLNNVDSESKADIPEDFDPSEIQEATEENLTIDALTDSLADQAEIIQDLFNAIKAYLTKVANTTHGVTLATGMPTLRPHSTGYFPMNMNMRNLVPGQRVRFWSSPQALEAATNENSSGQKAMKNSVSLAADNDKEGSAFFLDSNGNPTTVVSEDASKMKVVPYLVAGEVYDSAFITVDATEEDQKAIEALAAQETTTAKNSSSSSSGGCDTGFGAAALLAAAFLLKKKR